MTAGRKAVGRDPGAASPQYDRSAPDKGAHSRLTGLDCSAAAAIVEPMRLTDELAAAHLFYPRPVPTIADVLLLDIPPAFGSSSLPFGRYYPIIIATPQECEEYMAFLRADRPSVIVPDLLDRRPTSLVSSDIIFCRYEPQRPGWRWFLLCHRPTAFTRMAPSGGDHFARGAYTTELFRSPDELEAMQLALLERLGAQHALSARFLSAGPAGTA